MSNPTTQPQEFVYVIHAIGTSFIKIGYSTNPQSRLTALQTASPYALRILGFWPGNRLTERRIHKYLSQFRRSGEWFSVPPFCCLRIWEIVRHGKNSLSSNRLIAVRPSITVKSKPVAKKPKFNLRNVLPKLKARSYWEVHYRRDTVKYVLRWHNNCKDFKCITFPSFTWVEFNLLTTKTPQEQQEELLARILVHLDALNRKEEVLDRSFLPMGASMREWLTDSYFARRSNSSCYPRKT